MPELPEVETLAVQLQKILTGLTFFRIQIGNESILRSGRKENFTGGLPGKRIEAIRRRGKFLVFQMEGGASAPDVFWVHLGMTGQLLWDWQTAPDPHVHAVFEFRERPEKLAFRDIRRFGGLGWSSVKVLGPEPLEISREDFYRCFFSRKGRIKSLLLNQKILAGIGNIYADESLFRAGIDPRRRPFRVSKDKIFSLHGAVQKVLKQAIRRGGSSIDDYIHINGQSGRFQDLHCVYGKAGKPCRDCGTVIRRIKLGGRSSFFCPDCQK